MPEEARDAPLLPKTAPADGEARPAGAAAGGYTALAVSPDPAAPEGPVEPLVLLPLRWPGMAPISVTTESIGDFCIAFRLKADTGVTWDEKFTADQASAMASAVFRKFPHKEKPEERLAKFKAEMTREKYHELMMGEIAWLVTHPQFGCEVKSKVSVDEDELFVGLSLIKKVLPMTAEHFEYRMPVKPGELAGKGGGDLTEKRLLGPGGEPYATHATYFDEFENVFEDFRFVDRARLLSRRMNDFIHIDVLQSQKVVTKSFLLHEFEESEKIRNNFGDLWKFWKFQSDEEVQHFRDYCGEEIAFFFVFFRFLTKALLFPAAVAIAYRVYVTTSIDTSKALEESDPEQCAANVAFQNYLRFGFGVLITCWAAAFLGMFRREQTRYILKWGMSNYSAIAEVLKTYDENLEQSTKIRMMKLLTVPVGFVFLCLIFGGITFINSWRQYWEDNDIMIGLGWVPLPVPMFGMIPGADFGGYMITAQIIFLDVAWGMVCGQLVELENHKTAMAKEKAKVSKQMYIKIINVMYPFAYTAFRKRFIEHCPLDIEHVETCLPLLSKDLLKYFFIHVAKTCAKIFAFSVIAKGQVELEVRKVPADKKYSYVEAQAKAMPAVSVSDEYFDQMIGFALVSFFGTVLPSLSVLAFFGGMVELRLLAFRYARTTQRPRPSGAEGIGIWTYVYEFVGSLAIVVMPALLTFQMHPIRDMETVTEFQCFLVIEHLFIALRMVVDSSLEGEPFDVKKAREVQEDACVEVFAATSRGHIDLTQAKYNYVKADKSWPIPKLWK